MPVSDEFQSMSSLELEEDSFEWTVAQGGDRLDRWLAEQVPDLSRARLQKLIDQGQVWVNDQPCVAKKYSVQGGDRITLTLPPVEPLDLIPEEIPLDILYEDDHLIIINKAAGMVVHPAPGHGRGTLVNALLAHCPNLPGIGGVQRPGIVHRLDKDTTGAIAVAKTDLALQHLQAQFKTKTARRDYVAVVHGSPRGEQGTVDQPIGRNPSDRQKMGIVPEERGGRQAVTHWSVVERLGNYTVMQFQLDTGRTHQIRVHAAFMGHPVVGDPVYSSNRSVGVKLSGQALHAERLRLQHPVSQDWIEAIAPWPMALLRLVDVLRRRQSP
jgi:23S rRNA pseudouridine1911/1915/1917 synthase